MESRISIKADFFVKNTPYIEVKYKPSEDSKDDMVKAFTEKLSHISKWAEIEFPYRSEGEHYIFNIVPIPPDRLKEQLKEMQAAFNQYELYGRNVDAQTAVLSAATSMIKDNSDAFRKFLDKEGVKWVGNEDLTAVYLDNTDYLFQLGFKFAQYKAREGAVNQ